MKLGGSVIGVLTICYFNTVVEAPEWAPLIILAYMLPSALSVPMWIPLSRKFGKIKYGYLVSRLPVFWGDFVIPFLDGVNERLLSCLWVHYWEEWQQDGEL